jgi:fibronectin-binding autotransporter adhesin
VLAYSTSANLGSASNSIVFGGGTLRTLAAGTEARSISVSALGGTIDTNGFDSTFSGNMTGPGGLTKTGAGTLSVPGTNLDFSGPANVDEGVLRVNGNSQLTTWNVDSGGTLEAASGLFFSETVTVDPAGQFLLTGGTLSVNTVQGDLTNQGGTLAPGTSPGSTTITFDYIQQSGATLEIEIGGANVETDFDFVNVGGTATLAGILDVSLINGFTPNAGQQFTVLSAGNIVNNGLVLGGAAAGSFNLLMSSTTVTLEMITPGLPGDFNQDGIVDAADYVVWRKNGGTVEEFNLWRDHFGDTLGSGGGAGGGGVSSNSARVPEPSAIALWAIALGVLYWADKRRRS